MPGRAGSQSDEDPLRIPLMKNYVKKITRHFTCQITKSIHRFRLIMIT